MNYKKLYKTILLFFPIVFPFIFNFLIEETFENAVHISVMSGLVIFTLFAVIFKRSYCGFFCMAGALQRAIGYIGLKLFKKRVAVPATLDKYLRMVKYILLAGLAVFSLSSGQLQLQVNDQVFEQFHNLLPALTWLGSALVLITVIGSLFIDNFFCRYICMQGAIAGVAGRFSPSGIIRCEDKCINCKLCSEKCPANLEVHKMKKVISTECFNCQNCIAACPKKGALTNSFAGKEIPFALFVIMAVILFILLTFLITQYL